MHPRVIRSIQHFEAEWVIPGQLSNNGVLVIMSDSFNIRQFEDDEVVRIFVRTFSGEEYEFFGQGLDVNGPSPERFKVLCEENKVGFKSVQTMLLQRLDGHNCAYTRTRRGNHFIPGEW